VIVDGDVVGDVDVSATFVADVDAVLTG